MTDGLISLEWWDYENRNKSYGWKNNVCLCVFVWRRGLISTWLTLTAMILTLGFNEEAKAASAAAKLLQLCPTLCDPIDGSPPGCPWDSPGKNTGVGCHFLLQCMKGKSESEVAQSCLTLSNPMDYSLPGSSIHGIPGKNTGVGCHCLLWEAMESPWKTVQIVRRHY